MQNQSLTGKERVLQSFDRSRERARFLRIACAPLPFTVPMAAVLSGGNILDATFFAMMGWALSIKTQTMEIDAELEILSKCVGRPRLAKALADRHPESAFLPTYNQLNKLDRLNSTQVRLLREFFISSWLMDGEDRDAAVRLLHR
jgi:hypothetical protein